MHAVFIPYGKKEWVDVFLRDIAAQKYNLRITSPDGKEFKDVLMEGQLRVLPGGIYEHIFPKEYKDIVLTTLNFHQKIPYDLDKEIKIMGIKIKPLDYLKKFLNIKEPKEFDTKTGLTWIKYFVSIIPLGIKEDNIFTETQGEFKGWTHEAI